MTTEEYCVVQEFDATPVLKMMEMLLRIAHEDRQKCLVLSASSQHPIATSSQLEHLICSLQTRLLAWCQQCLADDAEEGGHRHGDDNGDDDNGSRLIVQALIVRCM